MKRKRKTDIWESAVMNKKTFDWYYLWLKNIAVNRYKWLNFPNSIDYRYVETQLFDKGACVYFDDENLGNLFLPVMQSGKPNVYNIPTQRVGYGFGYTSKGLTIDNSVIVWDNYLRYSQCSFVEMYARRLSEIQRTIDVNVNALKNPVIIRTNENTRLTLKNAYMQYDGNEPCIVIDDNVFSDGDFFDCINLNTPNNVDKLYTLLHSTMNQILTYFGINNANQDKKERLVASEVDANNDQIENGLLIGLDARRQGAEKINKMFGTNIEVVVNQDFLSQNFNFITDISNFIPSVKDEVENE